MMRMAIQVVFFDEAGAQQGVHEVVTIGRDRLCPAGLGISLAEAKQITGGIQQILASAQITEWQADQRTCPNCSKARPLKGHHPIVFRTPFGKLRLNSERVRVCPCTAQNKRSVSPLAELLEERSSPEMLYLETKFASLVSYGLSARLMDEILPFDRPIGGERVRRHLFQVAQAHEAGLAAVPKCIEVDQKSPRQLTGPDNFRPDGPIFVGMDGGYIRGREQDWFEAIAGKSLASFHRNGGDTDPSGRCFAYVQTVDDKPRARLVDTLRRQGMQPQQQVIFMSDGAETLRRLQQNIAPEAEHVLDWFHVTMRLTVLGQMIKGAWRDASEIAAKAASLERIKWWLWHGNAQHAIDSVECMADDVISALEEDPVSPQLRKLGKTLGEFSTYITNNANYIVNYGERFRGGERISTGFVESAVNQIVDKRFDKSQSMRWTPTGAHLVLQTRTRVLNGDLDQLIRDRYPNFRKPTEKEFSPAL